jgi:hypothetical protein
MGKFKISVDQFKISTDQLKTSIISWKLFYLISVRKDRVNSPTDFIFLHKKNRLIHYRVNATLFTLLHSYKFQSSRGHLQEVLTHILCIP